MPASVKRIVKPVSSGQHGKSFFNHTIYTPAWFGIGGCSTLLLIPPHLQEGESRELQVFQAEGEEIVV